MANTVVWLDIPVLDLDRAIKFYSAVLGAPVKREEFSGMALGIFPHANNDVGGCLFKKDGEKPGANGPLVYLNAQGRLVSPAHVASVGCFSSNFRLQGRFSTSRHGPLGRTGRGRAGGEGRVRHSEAF